MNIKTIRIDATATIGERVVLIDQRPLFSYQEGVKGAQEGITVTVLSESAGYEKIDVKIPGMMKLPFDFNDTPIQVEFDGLEARIWQDWGNKGAIKLTATAKGIKASNKKLQLNN